MNHQYMKPGSYIVYTAMLLTCCSAAVAQDMQQQVVYTLKKQVLANAARVLDWQPVTVTSSRAERSAGGPHDFYSEGDYWWPDPDHPDSPYIRKDGLSNPGNFTAHREAMIRFSEVVGNLAAAYVLTHQKKYIRPILQHCKAWFTDTATCMTPHLLYAQAIKGRVTGRGIGIIDAIQLVEVVKGLEAIEPGCNRQELEWVNGIRNWFAQYLQWVTTHPYGKEEMNAINNHGTCWVMQVAVFAQFTGNDRLMAFCRQRYKAVLLPQQMAADGSFPLELKRTKPYGYSIFNLDAMATICQTLSTPADDLWDYSTADGRSIRKGIIYLYPFIADKSTWPLPPDVMYWDNWPVAQPFLLLGAMAFKQQQWLDTWTKLDHAPVNPEVIRNLPVRHPLLWLPDAGGISFHQH